MFITVSKKEYMLKKWLLLLMFLIIQLLQTSSLFNKKLISKVQLNFGYKSLHRVFFRQDYFKFWGNAQPNF